MDIKGHDLPLLVSLQVMLEERNITRAAARLGISQPALSAQLARLRDIFGDRLLVPAASGKGMILTQRASELSDPLRSALKHVDGLLSRPAPFDPERSSRTFTIGANDNATAIIGTRLVSHTRNQGFFGIRYAFLGIDFAKLPSQLETGALDIALASKNAVPSGMPNEPLLEEHFMMAQRKDHPRGTRAPSLREYAKLDHVIVSGDGGGFRGFIDDILATRGLTRHVSTSVQHYSVVPLLLQSTDLVSTLPLRFLDRYSRYLRALRLPFDARPFTLYSTWHARSESDAGLNWLRKQLLICASQ